MPIELPHLIEALRAAQAEGLVSSIILHGSDLAAIRACIGRDVAEFDAPLPGEGADSTVRVAGDDPAPTFKLNGVLCIEGAAVPGSPIFARPIPEPVAEPIVVVDPLHDAIVEEMHAADESHKTATADTEPPSAA